MVKRDDGPSFDRRGRYFRSHIFFFNDHEEDNGERILLFLFFFFLDNLIGDGAVLLQDECSSTMIFFKYENFLNKFHTFDKNFQIRFKQLIPWCWVKKFFSIISNTNYRLYTFETILNV